MKRSKATRTARDSSVPPMVRHQKLSVPERQRKELADAMADFEMSVWESRGLRSRARARVWAAIAAFIQAGVDNAHPRGGAA